MPGANCSIFGCGTNRRHTGVGIFRIPSGNDQERSKRQERSKAIRDEWIKVITKDRVVDANFRKQIESGNVYVCERHFKKEEIECRKYYAIFLAYYIIFNPEQTTPSEN